MKETIPQATDSPKRASLREMFPIPSYQEWRQSVEEQLKGAPFEKVLQTKTYEGITLKPMYWQEDAASLEVSDALPGFPPYTRGTKFLGYQEKSWDVGQQQTTHCPTKLNTILKEELTKGLSKINLHLNNTTRSCLPESGKDKSGLALYNYEDFKRCFDGIYLNMVPLDIDAGGAALYVYAMLLQYAKETNLDTQELEGAIYRDPLSDLAKIGYLNTDIEKAYHEMAQLTKWASEYSPKMRTIGIATTTYANAGASAVEELGFFLATAADYIDGLLDKGLTVDAIASHVQCNLSIGSQFFMEIAKSRAARIVWANLIKAYGGNEESQKLYIHGQSTLLNKTEYDPYTNILRTTTEAFSAVLGGVDSLSLTHFDETIRRPDDFSRRVARNQQIVLLEEAHGNFVIDPAGGSWYVESITTELAQKAWALFQEIRQQGGMYRSLQNKIPHEKLDVVMRERMKNFHSRKDVLVGINMFANPTETRLESCSCGKHPEDKSCSCERISPEWKQKLDTCGYDNLALLMEAVAANVCIADLAEMIRKNGHVVTQITPITAHRVAEQFENLRTEIATTGGLKVFLANIGPLSALKPRADFSTGFFQVAGMDVLDSPFFSTVEEALLAAQQSQAAVVCLCAADDLYPSIAPQVVPAIKKAMPGVVVALAGYPTEQIEALKLAGVEFFVHLRADAYQTLKGIYDKVGAQK